jgi:putative aminopeptidase FrvX
LTYLKRGISMDTVGSLRNIMPGITAPKAGADSAQSPREESPPAGDTVSVSKEVADTRRSWKLKGKKLGSFTAASAMHFGLSYGLVMALPFANAFAVGMSGILGGLALAALEEKHIGIGRIVGGAIGSAAGTLGGLAKAGFKKMAGIKPETEGKIILPKEKPRGSQPREPLLQSLLHKGEEKILGHRAAKSQASEFGEGIGVFGATTAAGYLVSGQLMGLITGPVGMALFGLGTCLVGMVAGGVEENMIGVGRTLGELGGKAFHGAKEGISHLLGREERDISKPEDAKLEVESKNPSRPGLLRRLGSGLGKSFLKLNGLIAQPLMSFIIDSTILTHNLFGEKPVQTINFQERPKPQVNEKRLLDNFVKLAGIQGVFPNEKAIGTEICRQLDEMGVGHRTSPDGTIIGSLPGTVKDSPVVMLSAHQDTVTQTSAKHIRVEDGIVQTTGRHILGSDDRAGIAEILEGLKTVLESGAERPDVKLVFTVGEEVGLKGSSALKPSDISDRPTLGFVVDALAKDKVHLTNDAVIINPKSIKYNFSQEDPLIQVTMKSLADAGVKPRPIHAPLMAGAGSDANTQAFNSEHIKSLAVGTGGQDVHTPLENIAVKDLRQVAETVAGIITNSCDLVVDGKGAVVPRYPME